MVNEFMIDYHFVMREQGLNKDLYIIVIRITF